MEIDSPPYPKNATSPAQLYHYLTELYDWTLNQQDWANMEASRLNAPESPFIPTIGPYPAHEPTRYINLSVPDMFVSWQALRSIREKYDSIVRNYEEEDAWTSDACIFHRINVAKLAALLLQVAFLDREKREAKEMEILQRQRKEFLKSLRHSIGDLKGLFQGEDDDDEEIDFDRLFNPEEPDED